MKTQITVSKIKINKKFKAKLWYPMKVNLKKRVKFTYLLEELQRYIKKIKKISLGENKTIKT